MNYLPDLVRVFNRIFFAMRFDVTNRRLDTSSAPNELSRFLSSKQQVVKALKNAKIFQGISGVQSTYETKVNGNTIAALVKAENLAVHQMTKDIAQTLSKM